MNKIFPTIFSLIGQEINLYLFLLKKNIFYIK